MTETIFFSEISSTLYLIIRVNNYNKMVRYANPYIFTCSYP